MNQCDRIKLILNENNLKQKEFAAALGVTGSYISKLLKEPDIKLSYTVAALIEEKYGYCIQWVLNGSEPKFKGVKNNKLSAVHQKVIMKIENMSEEQIKAVMAFIRFLEMDN